MNSADFDRVRGLLGLTRKGFAAALGLDIRTTRGYERGVAVPRVVALACGALLYGLPPVGGLVKEEG